MTKSILSNQLKILLIAAPKSGGTYLRSKLEKNLDLKYTRITDGIFPKVPIKLDKFEEFYLNQSVTHTHADADELNILVICKAVDRFIFHVRDPRNTLVSWIHHFDNCNLKEHASAHICHLNLITQYFPYFGEKYTSLSFDDKVELCYDLFYKELLIWLDKWFIELKIDFDAERKDIYTLHSLNYAKNKKYNSIDDVKLNVLLTTHEDLVHNGDEHFFNKVLNFYSIKKNVWKNIEIEKNMNVNFRSGKINSYKHELSDKQQRKLTNIIPSKWLSFFNWEKV